MTIGDYIKQRFQSFGIQLSEADIFDLCIGFNSDDKVSDGNYNSLKRAICKFIPNLMARPNISESGFSISYDKAGLKLYYQSLCKELGMSDELGPKVTFIHRYQR